MKLNLSFRSGYFAKRSVDTAVAAVAITLLAPLFMAIAVAIRTDSRGPILFRQTRVGLRGRYFEMIKFRTMSQSSSSSVPLTVAGDDRITTVGRFLRSWKLDELPQLINVIRGEMSLVGPRPEIPQYVDKYSEHDRRIVLSVLPGMTDFASIAFRNESELLAAQSNPVSYYERVVMPKKLRYCRYYVKHSSFSLDLRIILLTVCAVFKSSSVTGRVGGSRRSLHRFDGTKDGTDSRRTRRQSVREKPQKLRWQ